MISTGPTLSWSYLEESSDQELAAPEISTMTKILVATANNTFMSFLDHMIFMSFYLLLLQMFRKVVLQS